jgi:DNA-binding response OmpR family regulator
VQLPEKVEMILLAGGDADLLCVLSYALRRRGYEIAVAPLGEMATARPPESAAPALVIVDDGGRRRRVPARLIAARSVPHILLTAWTPGPVVGGSLGWAAVVPKPFRVADLARIIEALGVHGDAQALDGAEQPSQPDIR